MSWVDIFAGVIGVATIAVVAGFFIYLAWDVTR
jgi:hypothetical protein